MNAKVVTPPALLTRRLAVALQNLIEMAQDSSPQTYQHQAAILEAQAAADAYFDYQEPHHEQPHPTRDLGRLPAAHE